MSRGIASLRFDQGGSVGDGPDRTTSGYRVRTLKTDPVAAFMSRYLPGQGALNPYTNEFYTTRPQDFHQGYAYGGRVYHFSDGGLGDGSGAGGGSGGRGGDANGGGDNSRQNPPDGQRDLPPGVPPPVQPPVTPGIPPGLTQSGQAASFQQATGVPGIASLYYQPQVSSPWAAYQQQLFPQNFVQPTPQQQPPNWAQQRPQQTFNNPGTQYGGHQLSTPVTGPQFQSGMVPPGQGMQGLPHPPPFGGMPGYFPYNQGYHNP